MKPAAAHKKNTSKPKQKSYMVRLKLPQAMQPTQPTQPLRDSQLEAGGVEGAQMRTSLGRRVQLTLRAKKPNY